MQLAPLHYGVHHRELYLHRFVDRNKRLSLTLPSKLGLKQQGWLAQTEAAAAAGAAAAGAAADDEEAAAASLAAGGGEVPTTTTTIPPHDRPHLAAYVYSDCRPDRQAMFEALQRAAKRKEQEQEQEGGTGGGGGGGGGSNNSNNNNTTSRRGMGVHALGPCSHNHDWGPAERTPPRSLYYEHLLDYRFVVVMENTAEAGYVTEKLGSALAAGAVPLYWGDPGAAAKVFNPRAFIDAKGGAVHVCIQLTHSLRAPGFNPSAYKVKNRF
jgi:hypothetical protein